ncbi:hypothetical protein [Alkaliphilus transvaalensis]|uniref:hypothetical protein n=1 Tax=Alkaliphilus transvaalensis TaxID=114628 RepID=UPI00047B5FD4|nr:hypothetical protein [Alkaliphilus transvaalensis]
MKNKSRGSFRNPQDIIDSTYNGRDYLITDKTINSYVMPLDMVKDVDFIASEKFYQKAWDEEISNLISQEQHKPH